MIPLNRNGNPLYSTQILTLPTRFVGQRLDTALAQLLPQFSRNSFEILMKAGFVHRNGHRVAPKHTVLGGETVTVIPQPCREAAAQYGEPIELNIVYQDSALLVINKPPGLVVHPGNGNWAGTLLNGLLYAYPELSAVPRAGIVHRLDKNTSGLIMVARHLEAQACLIQQLQARQAHRYYLALVHGWPAPRGTINLPIGRHPKDRMRMAVVKTGKPAVTHYRRLEQINGYACLECRLETGRTHQIRVHLAQLGYPVIGDTLYGKRLTSNSLLLKTALDRFSRHALHAWQLSVVHPSTQQTMRWQLPIPQDILSLWDTLKNEV